MSGPLGQHLGKREKRSDDQQWSVLYRKAIRLARKHNADHTRKLLETHEDNQEEVLRRLSIVSEKDLDREFGAG